MTDSASPVLAKPIVTSWKRWAFLAAFTSILLTSALVRTPLPTVMNLIAAASLVAMAILLILWSRQLTGPMLAGSVRRMIKIVILLVWLSLLAFFQIRLAPVDQSVLWSRIWLVIYLGSTIGSIFLWSVMLGANWKIKGFRLKWSLGWLGLLIAATFGLGIATWVTQFGSSAWTTGVTAVKSDQIATVGGGNEWMVLAAYILTSIGTLWYSSRLGFSKPKAG
jgi:hypothetical protein